ncbi:hypothetical protein D3C87_1491780 [compost metagenome]
MWLIPTTRLIHPLQAKRPLNVAWSRAFHQVVPINTNQLSPGIGPQPVIMYVQNLFALINLVTHHTNGVSATGFEHRLNRLPTMTVSHIPCLRFTRGFQGSRSTVQAGIICSGGRNGRHLRKHFARENHGKRTVDVRNH